jgi:hypothetical protein
VRGIFPPDAEADVVKIPHPLFERFTDALCSTASWIKSSLEYFLADYSSPPDYEAPGNTWPYVRPKQRLLLLTDPNINSLSSTTCKMATAAAITGTRA